MRHAFLLLALALLTVGCSGSTPDETRDELLAAPYLRRVLPTRGQLSGGLSVGIDGDGFVEGVRVFFGDTESPSVTIVSPQRLTAVTPESDRAQSVRVRVMNRDGQFAALDNAFLYDLTAPVITEAVLQLPPESFASSNESTVPFTVTADVEVFGTTDGVGKGLGIRAQVGYASFTSGGARLEDYFWTAADYSGDAEGTVGGDKTRDRYRGVIEFPAAAAGTSKPYFVAARFSIDGGITWVVADRDGIRTPPTSDSLAIVRVQRAVVNWCKLGGPDIEPPPTVTQPSAPASGVTFLAQTYHPTVGELVGTVGVGAGGVEAELGHGPFGTHPDDGGWTWLKATWAADRNENSNDEFSATLPILPNGRYSVVYRARIDQGPWRYCDADGSAENDFTVEQMGTLQVGPPSP